MNAARKYRVGTTERLAEGLWFIHGDMPDPASRAPDFCNVVVYRAGRSLYLVDSGGGAAIRASIRRILQAVGPVDRFTLINTHVHLDHICNNDVIAEVQAATRHHYLLHSGIDSSQLDAPGYFAEQFNRLEAVYDPLSSYRAERIKYRHRGQAQISTLLRTVLDDHTAFEQALADVFAADDGLTPAEVYERFKHLRNRPVVAKYLDLEFPHSPPSLQNMIVTTLLQLGYEASGPRRHQRFYRSSAAAGT